ncbi:MAG: monovalent cation/H+ antiporter subunit D family protein [Wenzhouxiangellaceae bacterium]|nr:monovalent cation/H+ antiporter subunit D family protein [Wenzhouxiangellaceae bacterium]MBS3747560.1 monovalent cation/H+ antiporter subunit D family protein [Wenzhouxiangellaceae bacterium]
MAPWLAQALPPAVVLVSTLAALVIFVAGEAHQRLRIWVNLIAATIKLLLVVWIGLAVLAGNTFMFRFELLPGLELILHADALSILFASLSAVLWLVTTVYAIAYLERSPNRARFFGFFSLCVSATMGIAMAGNLMTLFIFYELLTLTTWPLVVHNGTPEALAAGRSYLRYTLTGGVVLLVAMAWLYGLAGNVEFTPGGFLAPLVAEHRIALSVIFAMLVAGFGIKAALIPLHGWLPKAMVAPAPVSALLHAVAVVKAGAFGIIRTVEDVYGLELVAELGMRIPLIAVAAWTIIIGSLLALREHELKRRLAYSTVSQVSYIVLGIAVGGLLATSGGMVHLVHQGLMKVTLFFCAGIYGLLLGVSRIDQLDGLGRRMPWVSTAFTIAALGMIGVPPVVGFVSKWYLASGALAADVPWVVGVLIASALLNAAYFLPLIRRLWLTEGGALAEMPIEIGALSRLALVASAVATAALTVVLGMLAAHPLSPLSWVLEIASGYAPW